MFVVKQIGMRSVIVSTFIAAAMMLAVCADTDKAEKLYIVHMDESQKPSTIPNYHDWYKSAFLSAVDLKQQADVDRKLVYTYNIAMHGFSALLTPAELEAVRALPGYVESYEDTVRVMHNTDEHKQRWEWDPPLTRHGRRLQITNSYKFLGLSETEGLWPRSEFGEANDIIVGVVDSGVWPESLLFRDDGMGPIPLKWKGTCQPGIKFTSEHCNRKLIGARYFNRGFQALGYQIDPMNDYNSARDYYGHGTFTSSIIAGQDTPNANFNNYGSGTAKGMAPRVRVAIYKVDWYEPVEKSYGITDADVVSAMEQAISDGVDIISTSLISGERYLNYEKDPIDNTALKAIQNGVLVVAVAGNQGPKVSTVRNEAPWVLTVGATTTNRAFVAMINLGRGKVIMKGISLYAGQVSTRNSTLISGYTCEEDALDPKYITGNTLFCEASADVDVKTQIVVAVTTGASAAIIAYDDPMHLPPDVYVIPLVFVSTNQSKVIVDYINSWKTPIASVEFHITELDYRPAPMLGTFSGVGPSLMFPEILKPDLLAPGIGIIAGCPQSRRSTSCFSMRSGTSFASPHVTGIAALLKAVHPDWSPAALKSAMMTTASRLDNTGRLISSSNTSAPKLTPLDVGCGQVNPELAANPGLVYDIRYREYVRYLCLTKRKQGSDCLKTTGSPYDLNLPTFAANFLRRTKPRHKQVRTFNRVLTNVGGGGNGVYNSIAFMSGGINVTVIPETLVFTQINQRLKFTLTMEIHGPFFTKQRVHQGVLLWYDGDDEGEGHQVTSPLVAIFPTNYKITNSVV